MRIELAVAIIAGVVALLSAAATVLSTVRNAERTNANARAIKLLEFENERTKSAALRQKEITNYSEPLARAAYDLQSRLFNILRGGLVEVFLIRGNARESSYVINNTVFLVGQYLCWTELARREIQFIDLGENKRTQRLLRLQDAIYTLWGDSQLTPFFRIFAGEQRAIGEAFIQAGPRGLECIGYGAFLKNFDPGTHPLIDALRQDVASLKDDPDGATTRLRQLQHALIDLLEMLDPECLRFPASRRWKA